MVLAKFGIYLQKSKIIFTSLTLHKNQLKWIKAFDLKPQILKPFMNNIEKTPPDITIDKNFSNRTLVTEDNPKNQQTRQN